VKELKDSMPDKFVAKLVEKLKNTLKIIIGGFMSCYLMF